MTARTAEASRTYSLTGGRSPAIRHQFIDQALAIGHMLAHHRADAGQRSLERPHAQLAVDHLKAYIIAIGKTEFLADIGRNLETSARDDATAKCRHDRVHH